LKKVEKSGLGFFLNEKKNQFFLIFKILNMWQVWIGSKLDLWVW